MHALVVTVNLEPGHDEEGVEYVKSNVVPLVRQSPGFVSGYWLAPSGGQGLTVLLFESEEAANAAATMTRQAPTPGFAAVDAVEMREVVAQA